MKIHVLTIFPDMFPGSLGFSIIGRALKNNKVSLHIHDLKKFAQQLDDKPFGGGAGMIIKCQPIDDAIIKLRLENTYKIFTSPRGHKFNQAVAHAFVNIPKDLLFLCGRYEGVDQRVLDKWNFNAVSVGDFVLCGGEVAVLTMLEACIRLIPGVVGSAESLKCESHSVKNYIEHNQYTQPAVWENRSVPKELLSGDHGKIQAQRAVESIILGTKNNDNPS